ncbi:MAG: hypothetical protein QOI80_312, partial [Solirubrobacteraceae bacterium]|nr:hypothetical protein [Solirubrobacteraceae bacterium]
MRRLLPLILLALAALPATALASADQESTFQDDDQFLYTSAAKQRAHLDELRALGVDRVRVTVLWRGIAPAKRPAAFHAADPAAYPAGVWAKYDNLVREAEARGIKVNFDVTGPSPDWANKKAPRPDITDHYEPHPKAFGAFVRAVGTRYSGTYPDGQYGTLPRVDYWSIWNEPNHSGWLTPTWKWGGHRWFERSAALYRSLLDTAYAALAKTGHGGDTILFGETAPTGDDHSRNIKRFMTPLRFVRALYCVDQKLHRLRGKLAKLLKCPASAKAFVTGHPALFQATGYAHHPYQLLTAPDRRPADRNHVTIAVLSRLEHDLDAIQRRYGRHKRFPIFLTEFGYQSRPDKLGVSPRKQAVYINQSEYLASRDRRVRTMSQFLLRDGGRPIGLTFQSGLKNRAGKRKPAYAAYRLPIWVTGKTSRRRVWGLARPAAPNAAATVAIQFRRRGSKTWKTLRTLQTHGRENAITASVTARGRGAIRLAYGKLRSR